MRMAETVMSDVSIGQAAKLTGVKVPTIRYYEEIGLLPGLVRTESNRRMFDGEAVRRLGFIRHARDLGFEIEAIRTLLALQDDPNRSCDSVDRIAGERLAEVRGRIAALSALEGELSRMLAECGQGRVGDCQVIEALMPSGSIREL